MAHRTPNVLGRSTLLVFLSALPAACSSDPATPSESAGAAGTAGATSGSGGSAGTISGGGSGGSQVPGLGGNGGGGVAGGPSGQTATLSAVAGILQENCGALSCHGGGPEGRDVVFTNPATLYQTLTTTVVAPCNDKPLVTPGQSANSALLMLPTWQCNDFVMPQGCIDDLCISSADIATLTAWIDAGAPNP